MYKNLDTDILSILYQLISLGLYESAYSLSLILGKVIKIKKPEFKILKDEDISFFKKMLEQKHIMIGLNFDDRFQEKENEEDFSGKVFFHIEDKHSKKLAFFYANTEDLEDDMIISANKEIGNTLCAGILNSVSDKLNISLSPSIPTLYTNEDRQQVENMLFTKNNKFQNDTIIIKSALVEDNTEIKISIFIIYYKKTFDNLLQILSKSINNG